MVRIGRKPSHIRPALLQLLQHGGGRALARRHPHLHQHQRQDHRQVADAVDGEAVPLPNRPDHQPRQRRPHQPRQIDHRGVQRNRVLQILLVVDHLHQERLPSRHIEGIDHPLKDAQRQNLVDRDHLRQRQRRQPQRLHRRQHLRPDQQVAPVQPIHQHPGKRRQHKGGNLPGEADQSQHQRRARQPIDQPARRHPCHPRANQRYALTREEEPEVTVPQSAPGVRESARCGGGRGFGQFRHVRLFGCGTELIVCEAPIVKLSRKE